MAAMITRATTISVPAPIRILCNGEDVSLSLSIIIPYIEIKIA